MTNKKDQLKSLFATGEIPIGEHFAEFIDDSYNTYKIVDMFDPNQAPSEFEQGVSVLVFNFDPIENPDWDNLFGGNVAAGDIMVRILKYDGAGVIIQEFDTKRNGLYFPDKSRVAVDDDTWGPMNEHKQVISVNGDFPDDNGNITVSGGGNIIVEDSINSDSTVNALSAAKGKFLLEEIISISDELTIHEYENASNTKLGHVRIGDNLEVTNPATISVPTATTTKKGVVSIDGTTIKSDSGTISVDPEALGITAGIEYGLAKSGTIASNTDTITVLKSELEDWNNWYLTVNNTIQYETTDYTIIDSTDSFDIKMNTALPAARNYRINANRLTFNI